MRRFICWLIGHAKPIVTIRRGSLMNVDWTFGRETRVAQHNCSRCGQWLATMKAPEA